ncbi:MAG: hypothetical protein HC902_11080 [Calothrix sp. SM1_5_4]|nr:hypothetical protein [Calothrix sp. SM1_5_4]
MPLLLALIWSISLAAADTTANGGPPNFDALFPRPASDAVNDVQKELECIRDLTANKGELIKSPQSAEMIKHLAPVIQDAFQRFNVKGIERALFYSQALEESGALTVLSESTKYGIAGRDAIGNVIVSAINDPLYRARPGAKASREFGIYRGRGLIQISRCDNYLSIIHYLNLLYAGRKPEWKAYWEVKGTKGKREIKEVCSKEDVADASAHYRTQYGMNPNLYGAFEDPMRFAMIDGELTDPMSKKTIASEKFMLDATLAYWRGRCGETVDRSADRAALKTYAACSQFQSEDYLTHASKCLTRCIKGSISGWERRMAWLKLALRCSRY